MKRILLCSSSPLLVKSLYAMIREAGCSVEVVEHPALAVQRFLSDPSDATIFDAEPFGLSAEDAARILRSLAPEMPILCLGSGPAVDHLPLIRLPRELDAIREQIHRIAA